jgi:uncharacterized protein (DUF1501 family)
MNAIAKPPVLVVVQLNGGNDFLNSLVPYQDGLYYDFRPSLALPEDQVLPISGQLGLHPAMSHVLDLYNEGKVAIIQGVGYPNHSHSHFRSMDIWHTCEPEKIVAEGWLGRAVRDLDPEQLNVLTAISFGRGLPRAMAAPGVPVTSVGDLDTYGLMVGITDQEQRLEALDLFQRIYSPAIGSGVVMDYLSRTGNDIVTGADILKTVPAKYTSTVEYGANPIARALRDVARVHIADVGTRVFYTQHGGYDTHASQAPTHPKLLSELSQAIKDFFQDLREHDAAENVVMLVFTEFGRRIKDNGSGTDHGSGGGAFLIGERIVGGLYAEYPSLEPSQQLNAEDLRHHIDFRSVYSTVLEQWLGLDAVPIVGGVFEQVHPFRVQGL